MDKDELFLGSSDGFIAAPEWVPSPAGPSVGGSAADYDGDGDFDLLVAQALTSDILLRNDGTHFTDVSIAAGITDEQYDTSGATWGDVDLDGDLDLILVSHREESFDATDPYDADGIFFPDPHPTRLFLNNGDGTFAHIEDAFNLDPFPYSFSAILIPQSGHTPLLYLINDFGPEWVPNLTLEWNGSGYTLKNTPASLQVSLYGMGTDISDFNYDQVPDILMSSWCDPVLLLSDSDNSWYQAEKAHGLIKCDERHLFSWTPSAEDFDNDGDLDVWMSFGPFPAEAIGGGTNPLDQPDAFFINNRQELEYVSTFWGIEDTASSRGGAMVDLDQDGRLYLIRAAVNAPTVVYWGQCSNGNWLEVELNQQGLNQFGIGSKITTVTKERTYTDWIISGEGTATSKPPRVHFGLSSSTQIEEIMVTWPDGESTVHLTNALNDRIVLTR